MSRPWAVTRVSFKLVLLVLSKLRNQLVKLVSVVVIFVYETLEARIGKHALVFFNDVQIAAIVARDLIIVLTQFIGLKASFLFFSEDWSFSLAYED